MNLTVSRASLEEWRQAVAWAKAEGWNPGEGDETCFHPTDPEGFFLGRLDDGRVVSAISVVTYSPAFAFLGFYLVHPEFRGRGLGLATWQAAFPHAGERTVGLDAVPEQEDTYKRSGFTSAYRTLRYSGRPAAAQHPLDAVPFTADRLGAVTAYDRHCFPAERPAFLRRWLTADGHTAYVRLRDGRISGYGVIRPAGQGYRIGPLFADSADDAGAVFDALTATLEPGHEVSLDIPEPHAAACAMAQAWGLTAVSHTVRMYHGAAPTTPVERVFGVTTLELG
ncbi:GNAT family N-acetyltransferase [Streptomyces orinoci]|uniref:GNAT family N-acetyltransferase n=1 Tax=Streptomyces orinoci TaxID=67339 RepID=A0ABV3K018_STRON|nr:GNAT family N-acetyltransferase [Streptomyces orinoci]